ncbi:hypothetical protein O181_112370 [Austropuccinia psidii MF-1]|uniref:Uncharacterized protein n=1 Tax=Austropuccinia psidii MF-1 TaxID=1389203 RepID=A0A9Q3K0C8_9BASI|nr:hypothetical protein [Austropuccinia psidii MF-1]
MPKTQRTDSCGTEGEDSVSSVSFALMTKDYASRRIQGFRLCTSSLKNNQGFQDITQFMAPSGSLMWGSKALLGPNYQSRTSPSALGKVLDPDHKIWALGDSNGPHRPQTADCVLWPMECRDKKHPGPIGPKNWPRTRTSRRAIEMAKTQKNPYDPEGAQRPFLRPYLQGQCGQDPSLELWKKIMIIMKGKRGPKINLANS